MDTGASGGIVAIHGTLKAARKAYLGLRALQHRGNISGIITARDQQMGMYCGTGFVSQVYTTEVLDKLDGQSALAYIGTEKPFLAKLSCGPVGIAMDGRLLNKWKLRDRLISKGAVFATQGDLETIGHVLAVQPKMSLVDRVSAAVLEMMGGFAAVFLSPTELIAVRDPRGIRSLVLGRLDGSFVLASETSALQRIGADYQRDIMPGEMFVISGDEATSRKPPYRRKVQQCIFEYCYRSRQTSQAFGRSVSEVRRELGHQLAREHPVKADIVIAVPDSGTHAAMGFADELGILRRQGLLRDHDIRGGLAAVYDPERKFSVDHGVVKGKRVAVVDDSLLKGNAAKFLSIMLAKAGARQIHWRIAAPRFISECYFGVETPADNELIARVGDDEKIRRALHADLISSLAHLSTSGLRESVRRVRSRCRGGFCDACFTRRFPIKVKKALEAPAAMIEHV